MVVSLDDNRLISTAIGNYCRGKIFLFMPNVCDAACDFCYVRPARVSNARLSSGTIARAIHLIDSLGSYGLKQVRLTGGEPLAFENIQEVVRRLSSNGYRYTILTNGIRIRAAIPWMATFPPDKVTISFHTSHDPGLIFGVHISSQEILSGVRQVVALGIPVAATLVCLPTTLKYLEKTLEDLMNAGVREYKIVNPNHRSYRLQYAAFSEALTTVRAAVGPSVRVRATDMSQTQCLLKNQGELSVTLPRFEWSWCCATVGSQTLGRALIADHSFADILRPMIGRVQSLTELPCANQGYCPIALTGVDHDTRS